MRARLLSKYSFLFLLLSYEVGTILKRPLRLTLTRFGSRGSTLDDTTAAKVQVKNVELKEDTAVAKKEEKKEEGTSSQEGESKDGEKKKKKKKSKSCVII